MSLTLADIAQNPGRIADATPDAIPALLGDLERVRATLWARLTVGAASSHAPASEDRLLTVEEATAKLGVATDWLYRRSKTLPFVVRPSVGVVRISLHGIEKYIRQRQGR